MDRSRDDQGTPGVILASGHDRRKAPWWRRIASTLWGYDFFVSYQWSSGGAYAVNLTERLRGLNYDCFLDRAEFASGDEWREEAARALRNTQRLVVIATRDAVEKSKAVEHELTLFAARKNRIIPIVFGKRFSDEERARLPALRLIPEGVVDIVEAPERLDTRPSEEVIQALVKTHRLLRRRSLRNLFVLVAFTIVSTAAVGAFVSYLFAELARREAVDARQEEEKQKHLAQAAEYINRADLLRETQGPKIEESLYLARAAYKLARAARAPSDQAQRAIEQALQLLPTRIGGPWTPPDLPPPLRLHSVDHRVVLLKADPTSPGRPYVLVAEPGLDSGAWGIIRKYSGPEHGEIITDKYGRMVAPPGDLRWLATRSRGHVLLWDVVSGRRRWELPFDHTPEAEAGAEVIALNSGGDVALARSGESLVLWKATAPRPEAVKLPMGYEFAQYALSPSGKWLAWARQNEFALVEIGAPKPAFTYQVTQGGGHVEAIGFVEGPVYSRDRAVFVAWSANQIMAMSPGARRSLPSHQAAVWNLNESRPGVADEGSPQQRRPDSFLVREDRFALVFGGGADPGLVILDSSDPVQWLDTESQVSFTLGSTAGPAVRGCLSPSGGQFLAVHADGTARLWDLKTRQEMLRFTAIDPIEDAVFLSRPAEALPGPEVHGVVTLDRRGRLQAWAGPLGLRRRRRRRPTSPPQPRRANEPPGDRPKIWDRPDHNAADPGRNWLTVSRESARYSHRR